MLSTNLEETRKIIFDAMKENNVISFTRKDYAGYPSCQERYVISISDDDFTHTPATSNSRATTKTAFNDVNTITVSYENKSTLKHRTSFKFSKLEAMMRQGNDTKEEKQPNSGGIRPIFIDNSRHPSYRKVKDDR